MASDEETAAYLAELEQRADVLENEGTYRRAIRSRPS